MAIDGLPLLRRDQVHAQSTLPSAVWDYFSAGSGLEVSVDEAVAAWHRHRLLPRVLRDVSEVSLTTSVLGSPVASPVLVAPTALQVLAHPEGEVATARGVATAGSLMVLSSRSTMRLEAVGEAAGGPWWLQVYLMRDRTITAGLVRRSAAAGATALVLTGDTPYVGVKHRLTESLPLPEAAELINARDHLAPGVDAVEAMAQDPGATFADIGWLRDISGLPVIVKGVLRPDDAVACVDAGAGGVVVSNHGGRQLDRAASSAAALAAVVAAVGDRAEVYVDGGIRDGVTILTALAIGARAVFVGRPALWALATGGAAGVTRLIETLNLDFAQAMALVGASSPQGLDPSLVMNR